MFCHNRRAGAVKNSRSGFDKPAISGNTLLRYTIQNQYQLKE